MKFLTSILSVAVLSGCGTRHDQSSILPPEIPLPLPVLKTKSETFSTCKELVQWQTEKDKLWENNAGLYSQWLNSQSRVSLGSSTSMNAAAPSAASSQGQASSAEASTNIQIPGVDEPDIAKMDQTRIFFARTSSVEILERTGLSPVQTINMGDLRNLNLLVHKNRLLVIGTPGLRPILDNSEIEFSFQVHIFARTEGEYKLEKQLNFDGTYLDARLIKDDFLIIATQELPKVGKQKNKLPCERIHKPLIDGFDRNLTVVHNVHLGGKKLLQESTAIVGRGNQIFMTTQHLYIIATGYTWFYWDPRLASDRLYNNSVVTRFDLAPHHSPKFSGAAGFDGRIRNQLSLGEDDRGQHLFIAATVSDGTLLSNRLWVFADKSQNPHEGFDTTFELVASSEPFGEREDIRSVRFMNHRAYIVTFEKTDPLFAFDLSQPLRPRLMSHLEIPGFSAYLHPLPENKLLGIGYHTIADNRFSWLSGIQLSLFQTAEDGVVRTIEQRQFGGRGSHVDAGHNHHAFTFDQARQIVALPVRVFAASSDETPSHYSNVLEFSGAWILEPLKSLEPVGRLSHSDWIPENCRWQLKTTNWWSWATESIDIRRVLVTEEGYISLSPFGARLHLGTAPFATKSETRFSPTEDQCASNVWN